ncbi:AI-2E family transporter [Guptibacillus algicola]|uniref:AI-2E family transporter n=1 Tax=Guptibacillus algicola TaxID=225844 RepID=UPI001CD5FEAA|nr:AI-2E family transporter [Alkalihalobacillus algicola]MCA0987526.1 AI-2E family transporter [Alkalihalobacillus algicola]
MWIKHDFFKYMTGAILVLILFFFLAKLDFVKPVITIISTLFYPILIAGFLYYIIKPIVRLVRKILFVPDLAAILLVFVGIGGLLYGGFKLFAKTISEQATSIMKDLPKKLEKSAGEAQKAIEKNDMGMVSVGNLRHKATSYLGEITQNFGDNITQVISALTGATTVLIVVPFVLFYFLKDDHKLIPYLLKFIPGNHQEEGKKILSNIDDTVAAYIKGQVIVAVVDGVLMYIAYLILGLDYALILGMFVTLTAVVPFFGPIIGVIPALVIGLTQGPTMALSVLVALVIVQQLEGNLVAPIVLGGRLNIHPLTIILLLIVAGALYGFIGMLIAIPFYSVIKVIIKNFYQFYRLRQMQQISD